jgi:Na+/proline symporter
MRELRALAAVLVSGLGWWLCFTLPTRFDLGAWYIAVMLAAFLFAPAIIGAVCALPRVTGPNMMVAAIAAGAGGPLLVWLLALPWETEDGTPAKLLSFPIFLVLALAGSLFGWSGAETLGALQEARTLSNPQETTPPTLPRR